MILDHSWQAWLALAVWTMVVFRVGRMVGRGSRDNDLSGPPAPPPRIPSDLPGNVRQQIEAAMRSGQKIEAIKHLREATGMGLKEAKEAIEAAWP